MENNNVRPHKKLIVWQKSIDLVEKIYCNTGKFPDSELYGLTNQIRRASVSVSANIAEGAARRTSKDYLKYLNISSASLSEVDTLIDISLRLKYIDHSTHSELTDNINHVSAMLNGLIRKVKNSIPTKIQSKAA
jgi:four helix bundle protein